MSKTYRIHEFAELAGVTAKALHHYDRMGLLKPKRNGSGYRLYTDDDLPRLQQIVALKFLGLRLRRIRDVLTGSALSLHEALLLQRRALEAQRLRVSRAIAAVDRARQELNDGGGSEADALRRLIEVLSMPDMDALKEYFSDTAWARWTARHTQWPSQEWQALYADIQASLDADPASAAAQSLASRWMALFDTETRDDPEIRTALIRATMDRERWASFVEQAVPGVDTQKVTRFIGEALWTKWEAEDRARPPGVRPKASDATTALLREFEAVLDHDPASARVQALLAQWDALLDRQTAGDDETKAAMRDAWRRRRTWPAAMRRHVAGTYSMPVETWERVMDFIDAAQQAG